MAESHFLVFLYSKMLPLGRDRDAPPLLSWLLFPLKEPPNGNERRAKLPSQGHQRRQLTPGPPSRLHGSSPLIDRSLRHGCTMYKLAVQVLSRPCRCRCRRLLVLGVRDMLSLLKSQLISLVTFTFLFLSLSRYGLIVFFGCDLVATACAS